MNPYNKRKEPTFGETAQTGPAPDKNAQFERNEIVEGAVTHSKYTEMNVGNVKSTPAKMVFSLHTKNAPSYTFTPVMKRPVDGDNFLSTLEEQAEQTMSNEKSPLNEPTSTTSEKKNGGFTFAPIVEETGKEHDKEKTARVENTEPKVVTSTANPVERIVPASTKAVVEKVPSKYRRLLIVILLLLLLLLAFFLLKPKTPESVETLQEQGSSLPIEFRPVDEQEAKRAEAQAKALQESQAQSVEQVQQITSSSEGNGQVNNQEQASQQSLANEKVNEAVNNASQVPEQASIVAVKPVQKPVVEEVVKPQANGSVIYQPETAVKSVKHSAQTQITQQKVAQVKVQPQPKVEPKTTVVKPVSVASVKTPPVAMQTSVSTQASVSSKTMTVPKGVSLMQVFRDHNLNISDVNAMSKVNSIVSNLKVGEKVTVRLDKNNRVLEMRIGSGGMFIRQANGSYLYK